MKKLLTVLLLIPVMTKAQFGITASLGYSQTPISKFDIQYKIKKHSFITTFQPNLTNQSKYPALTLGATYGYNLGVWQPVIGYSSEGFVAGVNRYCGVGVIGAGIQGNYPYISIGITTLKVKGKDLFTGNDYAIGGLQLISGFFMGWHESIQAGHWGKGHQFWDNTISWKNKYKDFDNGDTRAKFIGSKTIFVGFTDGYHLTNLITNSANIATLSFAIGGKEKKNWKVIAKKILIGAAVNRAAFHISYNSVFN